MRLLENRFQEIYGNKKRDENRECSEADRNYADIVL